MARIIPNENTWIGWLESFTTGTVNEPDLDDIVAATDWTCWLVSLNASSQGNTIPTPQLCTLFETTAAGTSSAQFSADFYRDDTETTGDPWPTLKRGTQGYFIISRFGGSGSDGLGADQQPYDGDTVEVWPVEVTSRSAGALTSNTVQMFTVTCAVNVEPAEDAVVTNTTP